MWRALRHARQAHFDASVWSLAVVSPSHPSCMTHFDLSVLGHWPTLSPLTKPSCPATHRPYSLKDLEPIYRQFDWPLDTVPALATGNQRSHPATAGQAGVPHGAASSSADDDLGPASDAASAGLDPSTERGKGSQAEV